MLNLRTIWCYELQMNSGACVLHPFGISVWPGIVVLILSLPGWFSLRLYHVWTILGSY
uniref:Uncharacterized protein n=1 Tax=Arundo donax TaxID=35708 RepID=A0A0A9FR54_ARUDO